mgnify:CR=1 FL=1
MAQRAKRIKRPAVSAPQNLEETATFVSKIGEEQRAVQEIQADLERDIDALKTKAAKRAQPHVERITERLEGLFIFGEANRDELTKEGKIRTVKVVSGEFGWRWTPPRVTIRGEEDVIARLKKLKLEHFIRTKEEINKINGEIEYLKRVAKRYLMDIG